MLLPARLLSGGCIGRQKSDMPDPSATPIFATDADEIGSAGISHQAIYWPIALSPDKIT